jgi:hypothetical protein
MGAAMAAVRRVGKQPEEAAAILFAALARGDLVSEGEAGPAGEFGRLTHSFLNQL